jgi:hypothetical protein
MLLAPDWRIRPSAVETSAEAASAAIANDATTVRSHLEYVLDERVGPLTSEQRRLLESAWRAARRLAKVADDLRDVARAETGELEVVRGRMSLTALVDAAVRDVWPVAYVSRKTVDVQIDGSPRPQGDSDLTGRAIAALVDHAVEQAVDGSEIRIAGNEHSLDIGFESDHAPEDDPLAFALAASFAKAQGGSLSIVADSNRVLVTLSFGPAADDRLAA